MLKKYLLTIALVFSFVIAPVASADTVSEMQAQLNALLAQIKSLQSQLNKAEEHSGPAGSAYNSPSVSPSPSVYSSEGSSATANSFCYTFKNELFAKLRGEAVAALHQALAKEGIDLDGDADLPQKDGEGVSGHRFGEDTASAVIKFQSKYGIKQTGYVGPKTLAKLNALYKCPPKPYVTQTDIPSSGTPITSSGPSTALVCAPGALYSSVTGLPCSNTAPNTSANASITNGAQTTSLTPTISGRASGVSQVGVVLSNAGGKVYGSGLISVAVGNWSVTVSPALDVGQYTITVYDANNRLLTTGSITISSSVTSSSITVTSPNGAGEVWNQNDAQTIRWSYNGLGENETVSIGFASADGSTCWIGTSPVKYGVYTAFPSSAACSDGTARNLKNGGQFKVKLAISAGTNNRGVSVADESNNYFTVTAPNTSGNTSPTITLTLPRGGENYRTTVTADGAPGFITAQWKTANISATANVRLEILKENADIPATVVKSIITSNDGSENIYLIGDLLQLLTPGNNYRLRVVYGYYSDTSDDTFTVSVPNYYTMPTITVTSPRAGATWTFGNPQTINWTFANSNPGALVTVSLVKQGGTGDAIPVNVAMNYSPTNTSVTFTPKGGNITKSDGTGGTTEVQSLITPGNYKVSVVCQGDNPIGFRNCSGESGVITIADAPIATPSIISILGPTTLDDGQSGTWTVNAQDPGGSKLNYGVIWGDEVQYKNTYGGMPISSVLFQDSPVFSHQYYRVAPTGTSWTPAFFVKNAQGKEVRKGLPVNVGFESIPTISLVSPASGLAGTVVTVTGTNFSATKNDIQLTLFVGEDSKGTITIPGCIQYDGKINSDCPSSDGKTLKFSAPNYTPGEYRMVIFNGTEFTTFPNPAAKFNLTATRRGMTMNSDGGSQASQMASVLESIRATLEEMKASLGR